MCPNAAYPSLQVEYKSKGVDGVLSVPAGQSRQCVPLADQYTLTPRGCHRVQPPQLTVAMDGPDVPVIQLTPYYSHSKHYPV